MKLFKKFVFTTSLFIVALMASTASQAAQQQYHGTECMTANLAQGQLFTWNKDGITNNFSVPLFVICPLTYDADDFDQVNPMLSGTVHIYYGNDVPNGTTGNCILRIFDAFPDTPGQASTVGDSHQIVTNIGVPSGDQNFQGQGGENDFADWGPFPATVSVDGNAHLLCLLPQGSTLRQYRSVAG